jgi:hypothetical protein
VVVGDFNADGNQDLAVCSRADQIAILLGNGEGTFIKRLVSFVAGELPASLVAADFNGDGKLVLAVANVDSYNVSILTNTTS